MPLIAPPWWSAVNSSSCLVVSVVSQVQNNEPAKPFWQVATW